MKKKVALLTSALLATTVVLGATSCASKNVEKLLPEDSFYSMNSKTVTALTKDDIFIPGGSDELGLIAVKTENKNADGETVSTTYKLFDLIANAYVSGVEITIPEEPAEVAADALTKTETSELRKVADGMYATVKTTSTRESAEDDWKEEKEEYTLYGRNGKVVENVEGSFNTTYTQFETKDGTRYYVNVKGDLVKENDPLARIVIWGDFEKYHFVGDYFIEYTENDTVVYDKNGKYVRTIDFWYEMGIPSTADDEHITMWAVGNYLFMQYSVLLPESEKKYDYIDSGADGALKYDLVTKRYDLEKGKVKDIDMEYVVSQTYSEDTLQWNLNDETVVLSVNEIKDERVMQARVVQSFDKKGKVAVDLQALVPGATGFIAEEKNALLYYGDTVYVVQGKKVVGEFVAGSVSYMGNVAYAYDEESGTVRFYNLDGSLNKAYTDVIRTNRSDDASMILTLEGSVVTYDTISKTETVVCTYDKDNGDVEIIEDWYVTQVNYGADKEEGTDDDTYSVYFLVEGPDDLVNLSKEEYDKYAFYIIPYEFDNVDVNTSGYLYCIWYLTDERATTTVSYYAFEYSISTAYISNLSLGA